MSRARARAFGAETLSSYERLGAPSACAACGEAVTYFRCCEQCDLRLCATCYDDPRKPAHPCAWLAWSAVRADEELEAAASKDAPI